MITKLAAAALVLAFSNDLVASEILELRYVLRNEQSNAVQTSHQDKPLRLAREVVVTQKHVEKAALTYLGDSIAVLLTLSDEGSKRFDDFASTHQGERLAILVNGEVVSAPVVREKRFGGTIQILGAFSQQEAEDLATALNAKPKK